VVRRRRINSGLSGLGYKTCARNCFDRSCIGFVKISASGPSSIHSRCRSELRGFRVHAIHKSEKLEKSNTKLQITSKLQKATYKSQTKAKVAATWICSRANRSRPGQITATVIKYSIRPCLSTSSAKIQNINAP
jgi:hypothetical protein